MEIKLDGAGGLCPTAHPGGASVPGKELSQLWRNWAQGYVSAQLWVSISAALRAACARERRGKHSLEPSHCTDAIPGAGSLKDERVLLWPH